MGAAKRRQHRAAAALPPAPTSSWWFDFSIDRHHLALVRLALFAVLAVDAFLQLHHAPRYGAGEFNVAHFRWLPLPAPDRAVMVVVNLLLVHLFTLAAFGAGTRLVVPLAAAVYGYGYFSSQLDSYQHHYLVAMLLVCASFVPWHAREPRVRSWALRLVTVQLAILYLWAAIAKLDPLWLDGTTLQRQIGKPWLRDVADRIGWDVVAAQILAVELGLAAAWLWRRSWPYVAVVGIAFHVAVEVAGFRIGLFSYVMIAIYLLMIPQAIAAQPGRAAARLAAKWPIEPRTAIVIGAGALSLALMVAPALWLISYVPFSAVVLVATGLVAIAAFMLRRDWTVGAAHLGAFALVLGLGRGTDQVFDYYRLWAGTTSRLGDTHAARRLYEKVVEIDPGYGKGHYQLGLLDLGDLAHDDALRRFRRAQALDPDQARGFLGEARVHAARGDRDAARAACRQALTAQPGHDGSRAFCSQLGASAPAAEARDDED
jgi:hypothetical protein